MAIKLIPEEIIQQYDLRNKCKNGFVYMQIEKGMYGIPQAGILANKLLREQLAKRGYFELPHTPGVCTHVHRPVWFTLVVDDFGIKFVGKEHAQHLLDALKEHDAIKTDWGGWIVLWC